MKFYLKLANLAIIVALCFSSNALAESRMTPEGKSVFDLKTLLWAFQSEFSRYPENWDEAVEKLDLPTRMIPSMEKSIDFANRYRIVNIEGIKIGTGIEKIVAMPGDPGKEGINERAKSPDEVSGRQLIVEDSDGKLQIVRLSDRELVSAFSGAGLKLESYTWAPSKNAPFVPRRTYREELASQKVDSHIPPQETESAQPTHKEGVSPRPRVFDQLPPGRWVGWYVIGAAVLVYLTLRLVKPYRKR